MQQLGRNAKLVGLITRCLQKASVYDTLDAELVGNLLDFVLNISFALHLPDINAASSLLHALWDLLQSPVSPLPTDASP